ncbi:nucleotidyltransferase [Runella sp.]|uniref:nucleotidyltransferase n=1 Tax=Runella sp. TaxID=1960881 RepID=UPI00262F9166|nr:nucleotidyltransferase [Runella sp.]
MNEENVEYVVLGGHAVIAHGYLRTTGDIDIFVNPTLENAQKLLRALERYGYTNGEFEIDDFTLVPNYLSFSRYDNYIDLMTFTVGVTFDECYTNRMELEVEGVRVKFINLPELIRNKKALNRPQDLQDLDNLLNPE